MKIFPIPNKSLMNRKILPPVIMVVMFFTHAVYAKNSLDMDMTENGFDKYFIGMGIDKFKNLSGNEFYLDNSESSDRKCVIVENKLLNGVKFLFLDRKLVRIDADGKSGIKIASYGINLGNISKDIDSRLNKKGYKINHYKGDDDYILMIKNGSGRGVKFFLDKGIVTWISAGTIIGLKMDEGCA